MLLALQRRFATRANPRWNTVLSIPAANLAPAMDAAEKLAALGELIEMRLVIDGPPFQLVATWSQGVGWSRLHADRT